MTVGRFGPGRVVFYDDSDGAPLDEVPLPDQRAVMADIPEGAVRVVVVAPVWEPRRRKRKVRMFGRRTRGW